MKDRIKQVRKKNKLTQIEFGKKIGVKGNTITNYETGLRTPTDAVLLAICREFNVNEEWLRTGEGKMFEELTEQQKLLQYTALLLNDKNSAVANAIQTLIITYEQLDETSKATLEKIALQYTNNLKKSQ